MVELDFQFSFIRLTNELHNLNQSCANIYVKILVSVNEERDE
jgi:hypothetical protein